MRDLPALVPLVPWLLALGSCSSPPKPPQVNESSKRPANNAMAVELRVCKNDLQNTRILAIESGRMADFTAATLRQFSARQQAVAAWQAQAAGVKPNSVYTVRFDFGSTRVSIPSEASAALVDEARQAPLIVLKGRTDGTGDSAVDSSIARQRAVAVRDHLVAAGVSAKHIRITYQPAGDHVADNNVPTGRAMNRRVEIEVYRAMPVAVGVTAASAASPSRAQP